ncbi:hypothetical protein [Mesobacillus boroniphilus]|nr:hypothetical protein [Mesobacillus boroniphilus]
MKSVFDFIGRTEATRGARRWSWIKTKSKELPCFFVCINLK